MVGLLCRGVEMILQHQGVTGIIFTTTGNSPCLPSGIRHVRSLGLRRLVRKRVVSVAVVNHTRTSPDSDKGNGTWLCGMGPHLGRTQDSVAMRQPGSGRVSRVQNQ